ncbi:MAG: tail fiber domain-containing protein, partial [Candidatus Fonsibacter sp.]
MAYLKTPTSQCGYIGQASSGYSAIELVSGVGTTYQTYIHFTEPNVEFRGRITYSNGTNDFQFCINSVSTAKMTLNSSGLSVGGTFVSASDKRLKFNEKPLTNALDVINQLEPVEYDPTYDLVDQYTSDTPQSHQCGFIAHSV